ncbi:DNA topoisomerase IV subunit A [Enterobacteriaceae endosymbiont of Plateumaris consimilis]|uniref:DNA topoisomerase IV subunit A n=1 Tax=Enterobacteriaceae endosymbiont of Plateumaris consimilis TaxID=2675794 RepID=UPI001449DB1A|nr:DNA topoisomerase IV subunit A [Enterobacteriaceae endosymbiont of Plateumaris consimilis]QJC28779.1 DNA topoisomerase IV subunit A [Enterobacteriaceae endosymbiont of Plateumaris consimilis]
MVKKIQKKKERSIELYKFAENAYLNYSIYVISDRALPHIGDGLKPVQRRVIYAMSELGLKSSSKFKKSARTIGDVIGKYHPHGDVACYEAMVLMAQSFSYRYPLIEGQGNWGSPDDPKSFAAMRYTESRLSKYSDLLLNEIEKGTVDYVSNFDGSLLEPKILPACLPNIILNGAIGIAVGMVTDIPPHNIKEVATAIIKLIDYPESTLDDILKIIQGPDFPTESEIITSKKELRKIYENGKGSIRLRSLWCIKNNSIIITSLPYQVSVIRIIEQITTQIRNKKLPMIEDIRDESDYENPIRIVIFIKNNYNYLKLEKIVHHLFFITDLEKSYRINLNMIGLNNKPSIKNLLEILSEWILFRRNIVKKRLNFYLNKLIKKIHILKGLLIAHNNLEELIQIIRLNLNPNSIIQKKFNMSKLQIETLLNLKLRAITLIEKKKIIDEQYQLEKEHKHISDILSSKNKMNALLKKEILLTISKYSNNRRSLLKKYSEAKLLTENELSISNEPITVILSKMGWIRSAKGHAIDPMNLNYKSGDSFFISVKGKKNQTIVLIDSKGRSYSIDTISLPPLRSQGEPLSSKLKIPHGSIIKSILMEENNKEILLSSSSGYGFLCNFSDLIACNRNGKSLMILSEKAEVLPPLIINDKKDMILVVSSIGRFLLFPINILPKLSKGKGNKLILIDNKNFVQNKDKLEWIFVINSKSVIFVELNNQQLKLKFKELKKFYMNKNHKGFFLDTKEKIKNIFLDKKKEN